MERKILFPNLIAELAKQGISIATLAKKMGISSTALYAKVKGATQFTLKDIDTITTILAENNEGVEMGYLFKKAGA